LVLTKRLGQCGVGMNVWPALPAAALILADEGQHELAVEIYEMALRYPFVANSRWFHDVAGKEIQAVGATLPPEVVAAAKERGRARDVQATIDELIALWSDRTGGPVEAERDEQSLPQRSFDSPDAGG
jgi:hypothetical protein